MSHVDIVTCTLSIKVETVHCFERVKVPTREKERRRAEQVEIPFSNDYPQSAVLNPGFPQTSLGGFEISP